MTKPPLLSGEKIVKAFEKARFYRVSQKGSHIKIRNDTSSDNPYCA